MRVYQARVPDLIADQTLETYVTHAMPLLPQFVIRDAFAHRDVKMNGVRSNADARVEPGAAVLLYTSWEIELPVVYEDARILILNKPAGISCEGDEYGGMSVQSLLDGRPDHPRLCHRLDNQTSGLLAAAKDEASEECLLKAFRDRTLDKKYECIVKGAPQPAEQTVTGYIIHDEKLGRMRVVSHPTPEARQIVTGYETLFSNRTTSHLKVTLFTGRTHQIRAHMAYLQHPILGDDVYGDRKFNQRMNTRRLMLCATELTMMAGGPLSDLDGKTFSIKPNFQEKQCGTSN